MLFLPERTIPLHLFNPLANQRVLVGVQIDVVGDRLVDEIAARTVLRGGQCIKRVDLFDTGAEADGFLENSAAIPVPIPRKT